MRALLCLFVAACAPAFVPSGEGVPRQLSSQFTGCTSEDVTLRDYQATEKDERWTASCNGRAYQCQRSINAESCALNEKSDAWISADTLVFRHNNCVGENKLKECHSLAQDYELGSNGVPPDRYAAIELYGHACKLGSESDCRRAQALKRAR